MTQPKIDVDVAVFIALKDEFDWFREILNLPVTTVQDGPYFFYVMDYGVEDASSYKLVLALGGNMGITAAAMTTSVLLQRFSPRTIVNIGIAGGLKDVRLGDVVVPDQVVAYLENAKAIAAGQGFAFQLAADVYRCAFSFTKLMQNFSIAYALQYTEWKEACANDLQAMFEGHEIADFEKTDADLARNQQRDPRFRREPEIRVGHTASGPAVAAAEVFSEWLKKNSDRSFLCVEMEAAGMLAATANALEQIDSLVIRAVSDFADEQKTSLERSFGDRFRRYAMHNASRLFASLLQSGLIRRTTHGNKPAQQVKPATSDAERSIEPYSTDARPSGIPDIKGAAVNPDYEIDLQELENGDYDLSRFVDGGTILITVGRDWPQDLWDRPVAAWIRDEVEKYFSLHKLNRRLRALVISDVAADTVVGRAGGLISIGGPVVNKATLRIASSGSVREISNGAYMCFLRERSPQVALWGETATGTQAAVRHYIWHQDGLAEFVRMCRNDDEDSASMIDTPKNGDTVGKSVRVKGTIRKPPQALRFWLVTIPSNGDLHPHGAPLSLEKGRWEGVVYLGSQDGGSVPDSFRIKLIAVSKATSDYLTTYLRSAASTGDYRGVGGIPHRVLSSVTVTRTER
jgi:nucleoside phosphorylase